MNFSRISFLAALFMLGLTASACVHPPHPPLPPTPGEVLRTIERYHYFPTAEVYYHPGRRVYFYRDHGSWLSAPILPPHIHIDVGNYVNVDVDGPKPYRHHNEHLRRYPPGLRKQKQERQREQWDNRQERKHEKIQLRRERKEEKVERRREHKEEKVERRKDRREDARNDRRDDRRDRGKKGRDDDDDDDDRYEKRRDDDRGKGRGNSKNRSDNDNRGQGWQKNKGRSGWQR